MDGSGMGTNDTYCGLKTWGPYCQNCKEHYSRATPTATCTKCHKYHLTPQRVLVFLLVAIGTIAFFIVTFARFMIFEILLVFTNVLREFRDQPHGVLQRLVNKLKILVVCFQIVCHITTVLARNIPFPDIMVSCAETIGEVVNISPGSVIPFTCIHAPTKNSYAFILTVMTLYPIGLVLVLFIFCQSKKYFEDDPEMKKKHDSRFLSLTTQLLFVILPSVSTYVFGTFYTDPTDGLPEAGNDYTYLYYDYTTHVIPTNRVYYDFMVPYASIFVLIYPVGIPVFFFVLMYSKADHIDPVVKRDVFTKEERGVHFRRLQSLRSFSYVSDNEGSPINREGKLENYATVSHGRLDTDDTHLFKVLKVREADPEIEHLSFLIDAYEPEYWYWEVIQCIYRVVISNIHIFKGSYQVAYCFLTALVYWKSVSLFAPYTYDADDQIADMAQGVVVAMLFLTILIEHLGCPSFYTFIFGGLGLLIFTYAIWVVWVDTKVERLELTRQHRKLRRSVADWSRQHSGVLPENEDGETTEELELVALELSPVSRNNSAVGEINCWSYTNEQLEEESVIESKCQEGEFIFSL